MFRLVKEKNNERWISIDFPGWTERREHFENLRAPPSNPFETNKIAPSFRERRSPKQRIGVRVASRSPLCISVQSRSNRRSKVRRPNNRNQFEKPRIDRRRLSVTKGRFAIRRKKRKFFLYENSTSEVFTETKFRGSFCILSRERVLVDSVKSNGRTTCRFVWKSNRSREQRFSLCFEQKKTWRRKAKRRNRDELVGRIENPLFDSLKFDAFFLQSFDSTFHRSIFGLDRRSDIPIRQFVHRAQISKHLQFERTNLGPNKKKCFLDDELDKDRIFPSKRDGFWSNLRSNRFCAESKNKNGFVQRQHRRFVFRFRSKNFRPRWSEARETFRRFDASIQPKLPRVSRPNSRRRQSLRFLFNEISFIKNAQQHCVPCFSLGCDPTEWVTKPKLDFQRTILCILDSVEIRLSFNFVFRNVEFHEFTTESISRFSHKMMYLGMHHYELSIRPFLAVFWSYQSILSSATCPD